MYVSKKLCSHLQAFEHKQYSWLFLACTLKCIHYLIIYMYLLTDITNSNNHDNYHWWIQHSARQQQTSGPNQL